MVYLDLVKIRLEIMLSNFAEKKETFFDLKKQHFSKSKKSHLLKGINPCFWPKNAIFFLYLDLIKKRLEIMLNYLEERKKTFLTIKNKMFQSPKNLLLYLDLIKKRLEIMLNYFIVNGGDWL